MYNQFNFLLLGAEHFNVAGGCVWCSAYRWRMKEELRIATPNNNDVTILLLIFFIIVKNNI